MLDSLFVSAADVWRTPHIDTKVGLDDGRASASGFSLSVTATTHPVSTPALFRTKVQSRKFVFVDTVHPNLKSCVHDTSGSPLVYSMCNVSLLERASRLPGKVNDSVLPFVSLRFDAKIF